MAGSAPDAVQLADGRSIAVRTDAEPERDRRAARCCHRSWMPRIHRARLPRCVRAVPLRDDGHVARHVAHCVRDVRHRHSAHAFHCGRDDPDRLIASFEND